MFQEMLSRHTTALGNAVEIAVGKQPLSQRREGYEAHTFIVAELEDAFVYRLVVEHVEASLIDKQWDVALTQILDSVAGSLQRPTRNAHIESFAGTHNVNQRLKGFRQWGVWVVAMRIKEVHIIKAHALQTLVERSHEVLPRTPVAVRTIPHIVACLGRDEQLVAIGTEIFVHHTSKGLFCRTIGRTVVVG